MLEKGQQSLDLENDSPRGLILALEPEGAEFILPPGKTVQVLITGGMSAVVIQQRFDANGVCRILFWPEKGSYELLYEGKRVWDLLIEGDGKKTAS